MEEKGMSWTVVLMSEISPVRIALFEDSIDAWIQIACPRLSIDWGEAFERPLLNSFEAEIALGLIPVGGIEMIVVVMVSFVIVGVMVEVAVVIMGRRKVESEMEVIILWI
ncbi:hypothetical protein RND81_06G008500 [Saponaria officinalis]|uniref:Uncharacterized protein n=1 Tax=Saponaria officinalis TaxID=3572 RepID=A0AAW1K5H5_SAPOF